MEEQVYKSTPEWLENAEDGSRDIILRLYEAKRSLTHCVLTTSLPIINASQTDMIQKLQVELPLSKGKIDLDFRLFEVKTLRLTIG